MNPDMTNDPGLLLLLAVAAWALFGVKAWRDHRRAQRAARPDAPKDTAWRNRWHR